MSDAPAPAPLRRREFLTESGRAAMSAWLALQLPWLAALASCAREDANQGAPFTTLTPLEGRTLQALAARILPSDDGTPGATEAGAAHFVDRAIGTPYFADALPLLRLGLADLDRRARKLGAPRGFATLDEPRQDEAIRQIEKSRFFVAARTLVVTGTFADPSHGGNASGVGWTMIGMEHRPSFTPPFGWYDANEQSANVA